MSDGITRRRMIATSAAATAGAFAASSLCPHTALAGSPLRTREALFYEPISKGRVICGICPRRCTVAPGKRGDCGSRENRSGKYFTLVYGSAAALNIDPIEKKPLFHFLPQATALSFGAAGCNLNCLDCQNWEISQARPEDVTSRDLPPDTMVALARQYDCKTIAYTYSEPVIFYEYMLDTAQAARKAGLRSVMISNGYINKDPMQRVCKVLDAVKIDWKGTTEEFYREYCDGKLQPVLDTIARVKSWGKWLEIVYLVVPTVNDAAADIGRLARWIRKYLGPEVPLHFSRFHPAYKLRSLPPTPFSTLERCHDVAREQGLHYVYLGNVPGHKYESTYCPSCGAKVIDRWGFEVRSNALSQGKCPKCGHKIPGVWK